MSRRCACGELVDLALVAAIIWWATHGGCGSSSSDRPAPPPAECYPDGPIP